MSRWAERALPLPLPLTLTLTLSGVGGGAGRGIVVVSAMMRALVRGDEGVVDGYGAWDGGEGLEADQYGAGGRANKDETRGSKRDEGVGDGYGARPVAQSLDTDYDGARGRSNKDGLTSYGCQSVES